MPGNQPETSIFQLMSLFVRYFSTIGNTGSSGWLLTASSLRFACFEAQYRPRKTRKAARARSCDLLRLAAKLRFGFLCYKCCFWIMQSNSNDADYHLTHELELKNCFVSFMAQPAIYTQSCDGENRKLSSPSPLLQTVTALHSHGVVSFIKLGWNFTRIQVSTMWFDVITACSFVSSATAIASALRRNPPAYYWNCVIFSRREANDKHTQAEMRVSERATRLFRLLHLSFMNDFSWMERKKNTTRIKIFKIVFVMLAMNGTK